jgi:hypothetical protein
VILCRDTGNGGDHTTRRGMEEITLSGIAIFRETIGI